jgi:molybdopterin-biosynthesis enzyme MoeA-like protein
MAAATLERDDLSVYVIAGVPRSFKAKLQALVQKETKSEGEVVLIQNELAEWVISKLRDEKRPAKDRTPASRALWRAYSALSAARYHLQNQEEEERVRELRRAVEDLWREISPMFAEPEEPVRATGT